MVALLCRSARITRLVFLVGVIVALSLTPALRRPAPAHAGTAPIRAAFLFLGDTNTDTWSYAHSQGQQTIDVSLGVDTLPIAGVTAANAPAMLQRVLNDGANVVFSTSFDFADAVLAAAPNYPNVIFEQATGVTTASNVGTYDGRIYQGWYLAGMAAGAMTSAGRIGYVAPLGIPEVVRDLDAFTLGARSMNPNAQVDPVWIGTFYDEQKERSAAEQLVVQGDDVIARESDSTQPEQVATAHGLWAIGYNAIPPNERLANPMLLTAPVFHWEVYYERAVEDIAAGRWTNTPVWWGMSEGLVDLAPVNPAVPASTRDAIAMAQDGIRAGTLDVFAGPISDNSGQMRVPSGGTLTDAQLLSLDWLVDGVTGTIPQ